PGTASGAITVGATTNSHAIYQTGSVVDPALPPRPDPLTPVFKLLFTDGPKPATPLKANLRDAAAVSSGNAQGCQSFPANAFAGTIALIQYGGANDCTAYTKVQNAQDAGAVAVLLYRATSNTVFGLTGVTDTGIPSAIISAD